MNQIAKREDRIRDLINHPWKQQSLLDDKVKWNKICASMDIIGDAQTAINDFQSLPKFTSNNGGYLFLYGLLQAFFMQQDAVNSLYESLFNNGIDWSKDFPDIYHIRELRNDSVGHPTNRNRNKSFHFISQYSISNGSFQLMSHISEKDELVFRDVEISELRKKQEKDIIEILDKIIKNMEQEFEQHKSNFKNQKITDLTKGIHYSAVKINEGIYNSNPTTVTNFSIIESKIRSIKGEITKRYGKLSTLEGINDTIKRIDYILYKIGNWIENNELLGNKDAEVFIDGFFDRFKELEKMLKEIDNEFS